MTVAKFLQVTSRFAPNSYYYAHPTDLSLASVWNTRAWITDLSLLSTVSVKVGCRKQVIVGTYPRPVSGEQRASRWGGDGACCYCSGRPWRASPSWR